MRHLIISLFLLHLPLIGSAQPETVYVNGIMYELNGKEATVVSNAYYGDVVIPMTFTYNNEEYTVTCIGSSAFSDCSYLTSVVIPGSVTSIGSEAFYNSSNLTMIVIPNSVISIGSSAFERTAWYDGQPWGLVYAGKVLYRYKGYGPTSYNIVTIKDGTLGIADSAFSRCSGLTSINIPYSVISIGKSAFSGCTGLTSMTIPNSVKSIGDKAFYGCI